MNITIVGVGYVGLITGLCFAKYGHRVHFYDIDSSKISKLQAGGVPFFEPGVKELMSETKDVISFADRLSDLGNADLIFICTGTPTVDGFIDLTYVKNSTERIGTLMKNSGKYHVVVVKSTVVPGSTRSVVREILERTSGKKAGEDFGLCMNPEFLREGCAIEDFLYPDRIVVGSYSDKEAGVVSDFYSKMFNAIEVVKVNLTTAELIKYGSNTFFPLLISYANEIANICERTEEKTDVEDVLRGVGLDNRVSPLIEGRRIRPGLLHYMRAGCGFGGSCFPKDLQALKRFGETKGYSAGLIDAILDVNSNQVERIIERAEKAAGDLSGKRVAVLGLSFKPNTDDIRESPALRFIRKLLEKKAIVAVHDPIAIPHVKQLFGDAITYCSIAEEAFKGASACFVVTSWDVYSKITQEDYLNLMDTPIVVDCRRIYSPASMDKVKYIGVGT